MQPLSPQVGLIAKERMSHLLLCAGH